MTPRYFAHHLHSVTGLHNVTLSYVEDLRSLVMERHTERCRLQLLRAIVLTPLYIIERYMYVQSRLEVCIQK